MRPTISPKLSLTIASFGAVLLAACSDNTAADDITADTTLGNVDVQQGTISDDMITPDTLQSAAAQDVQSQQDDTGLVAGDGTAGEKSEDTVQKSAPPASDAPDEE